MTSKNDVPMCSSKGAKIHDAPIRPRTRFSCFRTRSFEVETESKSSL